VAPAAGEVHMKLAQVEFFHLPSNIHLVAICQEELLPAPRMATASKEDWVVAQWVGVPAELRGPWFDWVVAWWVGVPAELRGHWFDP
jgi:hypothetical protein